MGAVAARVTERPHRLITDAGLSPHLATFWRRILDAQADGASISDLSTAPAHPGAVLHRRSTSNASDREGAGIVIGPAGIVVDCELEDTPKAKFMADVPQLCHGNIKPHLLQKEEMRCEDSLNDPVPVMRIEQLLGHSVMREL
jgi:hypothetical protein